jgi:hypothetical protein
MVTKPHGIALTLLSQLYDLLGDNLCGWVRPVSQTQFTQCAIERRGEDRYLVRAKGMILQ